ncbi:MAG: outer-membrane lipoprotein carrier protein LolA, partial [Pseudomonadota bacterium]
MTLPMTALAAILSITTLPYALQVDLTPSLDAGTEIETEVNGTDSADTAPLSEDEPAVRAAEEGGVSSPESLPAGLPVSPGFDAAEPVSPEPYVDPSVVTGDARDEIVSAAAAALSAVETAEGRFVQVAPDFSITEGQFYLRRPGRVRFEYDAPVPILVVADGATVAIEDKDLETQDR